MAQWKDSPTKKSIAELSRPGREEQEVARNKHKKPQGRKCVHEPSDAKYMNWHSPFLWSQICDAAKHPSVGYQMSATRICDVLKVKNPKTFGNIRVSTVDGWIDHTGPKARWLDAAIGMAEKGNRQGGYGGDIGVLVSKVNRDLQIEPHFCNRNIIR